MGKSIKIIKPKYIKEFKCVGGTCKDSCCIGWDVDIDKVTFRQYYKVQDKEMKKMFQKNVHNNENCYSEDVDYGKVKLKKGKRCPFLDEKNYCIIYSRIGEEYLSNVCTCFPRITNKIDEFYEMSLDVSCPEAARLILLKEEGIEFEQLEETLGKHIISGEINTKSKQANNLSMKYFKEIRDLSIKIMQNRKYDLSERLYILGDFLEKLEEELDYNFNNVNKFIKEYDMKLGLNYYDKNKLNYVIQVSFFKNILDSLNVFEEVDSDSFKEYTKEVIQGFNFKDIQDMTKNSEAYIKAFEEYDKIIKKNRYIFENYIVNFIYNNLFPFSETKKVFDGYIMLLVRYSFIRFYLVGIYLCNKSESKEEIVRLIQVFSKTTEHHKTFLADTLRELKGNEFDNIEFTKTLL